MPEKFFESPAEFDFMQAPQSVRDRSVLTFYTQNFISLRGAKISMENLRGAKIFMENLRGAKISVENFRVSGLKKDRPLSTLAYSFVRES